MFLPAHKDAMYRYFALLPLYAEEYVFCLYNERTNVFLECGYVKVGFSSFNCSTAVDGVVAALCGDSYECLFSV